MRAPAILIGILALLLASCGVESQVRVENKDELGKVKGPETAMMDATLKEQADQAIAAGNYTQAAEMYRQLHDKTPDNKDYTLGLAESLRRAGDYSDSLLATDALLKKDPNNASALENKGLCLMSMSTGKFTEAGDTFGAVMKQDTKRWRTLNAIGILFAMKGKYDPAMQYFQAALNVSPDNPSVLNNAALTYAIDRKFDRAYDAFDRARRHVQLESNDMKHLDLNLALVYAVDGKLDEAQRVASPHLSKEALYNNMGFYSYLAKNNDSAKVYLNMALTQSPTYYERAWKNLGALTGDASANTGEGQPMPATMMQRSDPYTAAMHDMAVPSSGGPSSEGVSLDDIPDSRTVHGDAGGAPASAPPVVKKHIVKAAPVVASPDSDVPAPAVTVPSAPPVAAVTPPAPETPPAPAPKAASSDDDNPDIILLHKPVPAVNGDWDTTTKATSGGTPPATTAVPVTSGN